MLNTTVPDEYATAIVLGLSPTGLYVARELGKIGVPLLGVDLQFNCAAWSRYFRSSEGILYESDSASLIAQLIDYASQQKTRPVLIPTSDHYIEFLVSHYDQLNTHFRVSECYAGIASKMLDKLEFHHICEELKVATPNVWEFERRSEILGFVEELVFPCLLKPKLIHLARKYMNGNKVLVAKDQDELILHIENMPPDVGGWLIQEVIPGDEAHITLLAGYSSIHNDQSVSFTARKLRQYPPGFGSASMVISEAQPETAEITHDLIRRVGFVGIFGAEFKFDERDNQLKLIEINARPTLWFHLSHVAGIKISERAYFDLIGIEQPKSSLQKDGVVWRYLLKDWASKLFYKFRGEKFVFAPPDLARGGAQNTLCYPVFDISDPMPFFAELTVFIKKLIWRVV